MEEHLLDTMGEGRTILFLYVNRPCVVVGKNQNPWLECNTALLRRRRIPLARRISGGGTVYHDNGNLNYSFMLPRTSYSPERVFEKVMAAVRSLGLDPRMQGKNSISVGGRKFSGNAFCLRRNVALHHGTLLVATDTAAMSDCLRPSLSGIATRAVRSAPAEVVNLGDLIRGLRMDEVAASVARAFGTRIEDAASEADFPESAWEAHLERQRSWEWVFGGTPSFDADVVPGLRGRVEKGLVVRIAAVSGGDEVEGFDVADPVRFEGAELLAVLRSRHGDARWENCVRALASVEF